MIWVGYYAAVQKTPGARLSATGNASSFCVALVRCKPQRACQGGPESLCQEGYSGLRCGRCSDGYYSLGQDCADCGAISVAIGLTALLAILAVGVLLFFIWQVLLDPRIGSPLVFALKLAEVKE
jgi:hypothetical protein